MASDTDVNVQAIDAVRVGRCRIVGKKYNKETDGFVMTDEADLCVCEGQYANADLSYYRKQVLQGFLTPADSETKKALSLP
jgi:hypothetical protein